VVVENDDKSTEIIKHLNRQKGGRVTFIPLNRVNAPRVTYPQSSDVIPLLKKLNFRHEYTPAFSQVSFYSSVVTYLHMGIWHGVFRCYVAINLILKWFIWFHNNS
jgi:chromosome segregation ATPase